MQIVKIPTVATTALANRDMAAMVMYALTLMNVQPVTTNVPKTPCAVTQKVVILVRADPVTRAMDSNAKI
jgi:hypothetical protein